MRLVHSGLCWLITISWGEEIRWCNRNWPLRTKGVKKNKLLVPWYFSPFFVNGKQASILKKNESLNSFAIHVLYVKYQRVSKSDKVEGRMRHFLRLQMKRWGRKGNFPIPTSSEHNARHRQVKERVRGDVLGSGEG